MSTSTLVQAFVIALIVGWSALFAANRLLPVASRRARARLLDVVDRRGLPAWLRPMVERLQPRSSSGGSCGDGCSACGGCAVAEAKPDAATLARIEAIPLVFRPRTKT